METLTGKLSDVLEKLGQSFLIAAYLPAALFILAHQLFLFPRWLRASISLFRTPVPEEGVEAAWQWTYLVDQSLTTLLLPLLLGVLMMGLNTVLIRLYEGAFGWQRRFLLWPWQQRNVRRAEALYGNLVKLKEAYTHTLAELSALPEGVDRGSLEQKRASLALEVQRVHEEISRQAPRQYLPRRPGMVRPTALGNAFAIIEEYPYDRYGMDGVLFWPRLRPLVDEEYGTALVNAKMILDLLLNLSLLAGVFGIEVLVIGVHGGVDWGLIGAGIGAAVLAWICYRGAVSAVYSLGDTITLCFDFFRGRLLEKYGLAQPDDLEAEQATWLRLGQFLRRGEGFYFPSRMPKNLES
ncbi:MAG: hypothetical protein ACE5OS_08020 [Anaerolineae bacterium]